jgi:hypothetical protein
MRCYFRFLLTLVIVLPAVRANAQSPVAAPSQNSQGVTPQGSEQDLSTLQRNLSDLQIQLVACQAAEQDEKMKKQIELLQKQIETQQKMIELLLDHVKKQPLSGSPMEKLQMQVATMESRAGQAAQRDRDIAQAIDNLNEQQDADSRNGPRLPATLKELFLPSRTNETPVSLYGTLVAGYQLFPQRRGEGEFFFDALEPIILVQLNDRILLESELEFHSHGVDVGYAQADYIVNDCLTLVGGRYLGPVGFFNERLHPDWINRMPDFPLMMRQVSLADFSLNGIQARGGFYLCGSPVKMEYSLYLANGMGVPGAGGLTDLADLGALKDTTGDINQAMAFGGRIGIGVPEWGVCGGFSLFFNEPYGLDVGNDIRLWDIDLNYHKGNWDVRFEYAFMFQESVQFIGNNIHRRGAYAQVAYRLADLPHEFLANLELVFRYSFARFKGIDPAALDLTVFESPVDAPVDRDQYTFGINYYVSPSLSLKFAYEINHERHFDLKDNVFLAQLAWGW